ncbi:MAG: HlyD family efflux transporter periplasmic adaptor subunit, partial [Planctomycetaceae bacterium]|nr:HlyD family efflux transporter periplasmic adaptor subunit [Planctomycetaceae bacterium]
FNANPLMRFDGYFILSELLGIRNLKPRADRRLKHWFSQTLLGLSSRHDGAADEYGAGQTFWLMGYGLAATVYRFLLVISISAMVATRFPLIGLLMAAFYLLTSVGAGSVKMFNWLWNSPETESVRHRARPAALLLFIGLPMAALFLPVPIGVTAGGIVAAETEVFLNAESAGELESVLVRPGNHISAGSVILRLKNRQLQQQLQVAQASLREAETRWQVAAVSGPADAARQRSGITELQQRVGELQGQVNELIIRSPIDGYVADVIDETDRGRRLQEGHPLAVIVSGRPRLRTWLNQDQLGSIDSAPGTELTFRIPGRSLSDKHGTLLSLEPAAEKVFRETSLTYVAGGEILVNPANGRPLQPLFQLDAAIDGPETTNKLKPTDRGLRVLLRLPRKNESAAEWVLKRCTRFVQKLLVKS